MEYSILGENKPIHFSKELCVSDDLDYDDSKSHEQWNREKNMQSDRSIMSNLTFPVHLTQYHYDIMTLQNSHRKIEEKNQMKKTRKIRTIAEGNMSSRNPSGLSTVNLQYMKNSTKSSGSLKRSKSVNNMNYNTYYNNLNIIEENCKINIEANTDVSSFVKENHMQVEEITFAEEEVKIEKSEQKMKETNQSCIISTPFQDDLKEFTQKDLIDALYYDYILSNLLKFNRNDIMKQKQIESKMNDMHRKIINIFTVHAQKEVLKKLQKNIIFLITQQKYFYQKYIDITFPEDTENCYYIVSKEWFQEFQNFLWSKKGDIGSFPGPITNSSLFVIDDAKLENQKKKKKRIKLFRNQLKMNMKEGKDYICVNKYMWRYIEYMYTGSPCIKRKSNNVYGTPAHYSKHDKMSENILGLIEPAYMKNLCARFNYKKMYRNQEVDEQKKTKAMEPEGQGVDNEKAETPEINKDEKKKKEEEEGKYAQNFQDLLQMYLFKKNQTGSEYVECDLTNEKIEKVRINMKSNTLDLQNFQELSEIKQEDNDDDSPSVLSSISSTESYLQSILNERNNNFEKNKHEELSMSSHHTVTYLLGELCKNSNQSEFNNGSISCASLDKFYSCCEFRTSDEQTMICSTKTKPGFLVGNNKMKSQALDVRTNEQCNLNIGIENQKCKEHIHIKDQNEKKEDNASSKNQNQDHIINHNHNREMYENDKNNINNNNINNDKNINNNDNNKDKNINNNNNDNNNNKKKNFNNNDDDDDDDNNNNKYKSEDNNESTNENREKKKKKKKKKSSENNLINVDKKNSSSMNEMSDTENHIGYWRVTSTSLKRSSKQEDTFLGNDNFKSCNESMEEIAQVSSNGYVTTVELETSTSDESSSYDGSIRMQNDLTIKNGKKTKESLLKPLYTYQNCNAHMKREDSKMMLYFFPKDPNTKEVKGKLKEQQEKKHNELTMNKSLHTISMNLNHSLMEKKHEQEAALRKKRLNLLRDNKLENSLDDRNNNETSEYSNILDSFEFLESSLKNQADSSTRAQINSNKSTSASNGLEGDEELDQLDDSPRSSPQRETILNLNNAKLLIGKEIPAGIINYSTTCYVNVVMQTLAGLYKLVNTMNDFVNTNYKHIGLSGDEIDNIHSPFMINKRFFTSSIPFNLFGNTTKRKDEKLLYTFSLKFLQLSKMYNKPKVLCANGLLNMLNEKYPELFEFNEQQDCHEFLLLIFDFIHNMMKVVDETVNKNNQIEYHLKREQSIISELFRGLIEARISCSQCEYVNYLYEPMFNLSVIFRKNNLEEDNLNQNLVEYFKREELHSTCEKCKCKIMYKDTYVYKQPNILIIHWIRLSGNGTKIDAGFKYELDDFSLEPILKKKGLQCIEEPKKYRLYSVIVHRGVNSTCGHYICYTRRQHSNGLYMWYKFDDANVSIASTEEVLSAKAYCLFYESK